MLSNYGLVQKFFKALISSDLFLNHFCALLCVELEAGRFVEIIPQIVNVELS
jgi:hypothetical protein